VFHLETTVRGSASRPVVEIYVDSESGVGLDECGELSRLIGNLIDATPGFSAAYRLDVSSPGIDRPLEHLWQFRKNRGRLLEVAKPDGSSVVGRLTEVHDDRICLALQPAKGKGKKAAAAENLEIPFDSIAKATIQIEW